MILNEKKTYLKSDSVKTGDLLTIRGEGEWIASKKFSYPDGTPKQQFNIEVEHNLELKTMTLNGTNRNTLINAWGKDTKEWAGKDVKIELVKSLVAGKTVNVIIINPVG
uniref:Uncharacterized protein n=1 Tax=viral metagenome TaxID=1070528 RepID=A0A6M3JFI4_9ZZZZ